MTCIRQEKMYTPLNILLHTLYWESKNFWKKRLLTNFTILLTLTFYPYWYTILHYRKPQTPSSRNPYVGIKMAL